MVTRRLWFTTLLLAAFGIAIYGLPAEAQGPRFVTTDWPWGGGTFRSFAVEPSGCILAAGPGLFRSCDGGATWSTVRDANGRLSESSGHAFVDPASGRILVSGALLPVQVLESPSSLWQVIAPAETFWAWYVCAGGDSLLFAAVDNGVDRSIDWGRTWSRSYRSSRSLPDSRNLAVDTVRHVLYLLAGNGLERSTDDGFSWDRVVDSLWASAKPHIAVTLQGTIIIANEQGGVLRSVDSGRSFSNVLSGNVEAIRTIHVGASGRIYLGAGGGRCFVSEDDGQSWSELEPDASRKPLIALLELPDGTLLGAVEYDERSIVRYDRQDGAWQFTGRGIAAVMLGRPAVNTDGQVFVPVSGAGVYYRSDVGGRRWEKDSTGYPRAYSTALGTTRSGTLLVGLLEGIARRQLGASEWSMSTAAFGSVFERRQLWFDTDAFDRVWVGTGSGAFSSTDDGVTWQPTMQGLQFTSVAVRDDGLILLGTVNTHGLLHRSVDGGVSYEISNDGIGEPVYAVRFLPTGEALVATKSGLRISRDDGRTWSRIDIDSTDGLLRSMLVDRYGAVYVASRHAIYVSRDAAQTWTRWTSGLSGSIEHLAIDSSGVLLVATYGAGMLRSEEGVMSAPAPVVVSSPAAERLSVRRGSDAVTPVDVGSTGRVRAQLHSMSGHSLAEWQLDAPPSSTLRLTVPTRDLPVGIYLATVITDDRLSARLIRVTD